MMPKAFNMDVRFYWKGSAMTSGDVTTMLTEPYPEAQARVEQRLQEIMDAVMTKDVDRLDSCHLFGTKFTKFDDVDPPGRQDAATMPDDQEHGGRSRATLVFVRDSAEWKITHEHFSLVPDVAA